MKIWGLEHHYPFTTMDELHSVFGDSIVYVPYLSTQPGFDTLAKYVAHLQGKYPSARVWAAAWHDMDGVDALEALFAYQ